jgi:hypothetical protein
MSESPPPPSEPQPHGPDSEDPHDHDEEYEVQREDGVRLRPLPPPRGKRPHKLPPRRRHYEDS